MTRDAAEPESRSRPSWLGAVAFVTAVVVSGVLAAVLVLRVPHQLTVSTDIVGYPIFADFNVDKLSSWYYIGVLFFPITALILYLALTWVLTRWWKDRPETRETVPAAMPAPADAQRSVALESASEWARVVGVGAVCGLAAAIALDARGGAFWMTLALAAAGYVALVAAGSLLLHHSRSWVNVLAAPLIIAGVGAVATSTRVTVASDGSVHHYAWLPLWAAIAITAAAFGWAYLRLRRAMTEPALRDLERRVLLFVASPVALFLLVGTLPGSLPPMDMFHEGEGLAAARLTAAGYFPWRDLMSIHGFYQDSVSPLLGMNVFENSRWGVEAGHLLLLDPLAMVFLVLFIAWLFKRNWVLLLAFMAVVIGGKLMPIIGSRFMFVPLVLLLLAYALERRRWWVGVALGGTLAVQAIFVPETVFLIAACGLVVILHDFFHRQPGAGLVKVFSLTAWTAAGGSAVLLVFALVLLYEHALGDFVFYFSLFAPNRGLAGGVPLDIPPLNPLHPSLTTLRALAADRTYIFFAFSTPAALLLAFLYYASKAIRRRPLDTAEWVIGAVAIFSLLYYAKFLERADLGHAQQVYQEAVPLFAFLVYQACKRVDGALAASRRVPLLRWQPAAVATLLVAILAVPGSLPGLLAISPDRTHMVVPNPPPIASMGYTQGGIDPATFTDIDAVLHAYLQSGDWVFDFSNEPGLYYYLLGQNPHTRYYHVSMAIPEVGQQDLIGQLEKDQPKLVVFTNGLYGLPEWDGIPNMVRHYDVSQYILDHYTPLLSTHTQIFYGRTSANLSPGSALLLPLSEPALTDGLAFRGLPCDWGFAPNFLSITSTGSTARAPVTLTTATGQASHANVMGWAVDLEAGLPDARVVVVANGEVVGEGSPTKDRSDVAQFVGKPGAVRSGFAITVSIPARVLALSNGEPFIQAFGVSASGVASEIGAGVVAHNGKPLPNMPPISSIRLQNGTVVPVRPGPSIGIIDFIDAPRYQLELSPPPGAAWSDYRWLEIDTAGGFRQDQWSLIDVAGADSGHEITFGTLDRSPAHFRVHVGSCAQWHGYAPATLLLSYGVVQDVTAVRLLP
jgi:hypothetical protein